MAVIQYLSLKLRFFRDSPWGFNPSVYFGYTSISYNTLAVFALSFHSLGFLAFYRPGLRDWGPVNGTQTGIFYLSFFYLYYQNSKKKTYFLSQL